MKDKRIVVAFVWGATLLMLPGCDSDPLPPPTLERLEQVLSVSFPKDCEVIGGTESAGASSLCLIVSSKPLPLPVDRASRTAHRSRRGKRPVGTPFPDSALANLVAASLSGASEVPADNAPRLTVERGASHIGQVGDWQFTYREAATESGWLTAVEIYSTQIMEKQ
ncbi:hypothetical protein Enr13x_43560 [Stieleria neptunia]|uniref:Uncharacterized protein n=1 Tax=Stieleria neptunia TaxID=2527979 RepID=A0A518HUG0_9BACT|nr:hypothetical protein [Stieleria neptunia]QDV44490.1 hypothetical protein Enr13x_43560 [Stieleria neptunia]